MKSAAKKGIAAAKEPRRAKKARQEFEQRDGDIKGGLKVVVATTGAV